jgi:glycosyltransferase involved in cell wall biosynthesis
MEGGGSERQTLLLLRALDREQFQPVLFLRHRRGPLLAEVPADVPIFAADDGADSDPASSVAAPRRIRWPGQELNRQIGCLIDCLRQEAIDVVYARTFHMAMLAGPACRRTGVPYVATVVSLPERAFPLLETRFRWLKKQRLIAAYRRAARVVAVSDAVALAAALFYRLPATSLTTIRNPVDPERLQAAAEVAPVDWQPVSDRTNLICIGRLSQEKGQRELLEGLACLSRRDWHLWIVGDGPMRETLECLTRERGLDDRVTLLGHRALVPPILARCQACIVPSHFEGMPNVVLEAMALGVPVIGTASGGTPEALGAGRYGTLVPAADSQAFGNAIDALLDDPAAALRRAADAQTQGLRDYRLETILPRIAVLLQESAAGGPQRA